VEIDPYVVEFLPPKDWTDYQYPPKITTLGEQLCALKETEYTGVMEFIKLQLDIKEKPQGQIIIAAPTAQAGPAQAAPAAEEEKPKEKSSYKLVLTALPDDAKIKVLKEVRVLRPGMKLLEVTYYPCLIYLSQKCWRESLQSKALVDKLPSILKDEMPKAEAEEWQKKLKEVGATCELQ